MDALTRTAAAALCLLSPGAIAAPPTPAPPAPKGGVDLARLKELDNPKLSGAQKATLGLRLYRDEMIHPTPRPQSAVGGFVTHDYVMAEITKKLVSSGADVKALKKTWEQMNAGEVKDNLTIFLALKGQVEAKDPLAKFLVDRKNPLRERELAATALGGLAIKTQDAKLGDVLAQAIREDMQGTYKSSKVQGPTSKVEGHEVEIIFPVRRAAAEAIRKMDKAGLLMPSYVTQAAERA